MFYTGVGSRNITDDEWNLMESVAKWLSNQGYILRSGKAEGADSAFENGVFLSDSPDNKEIYIPWKDFKGNKIPGETIALMRPTTVNFALSLQEVKEIHPAFDRLSQGAIKLHQRNIHQVLGRNLEEPSPSNFLLACSDSDKNRDAKGGTATAWKLAKKYNVPCFNLRDKTKQELFQFLKSVM